jgi:hypothetical protein
MPDVKMFERVLAEAHQKGMEAGNAAKPVPMVVGHAKSILSDEIDYSRPVEVVLGGVCGFAWVHLPKGNTSFARWAVKNNTGFRKSEYEGGALRSCHDFGQSMERKENYCRAFAKHLRDNGIEAHCMSRMD